MASINPVRYPGGKGRKHIVDGILSMYPKSYFADVCLIEPFCGGSGLSLSMVNSGEANSAFFNDGDPRIADMWQAIAYDTDKFIDAITNTQVNMKTFREAKDTANDENASVFDRGYATYVLNRCCRSGYIDGGVIGGNNQAGTYKVDARFNKVTLKNRIRNLKALVEQNKIGFSEGYDGIEFIKNIVAFTNDEHQNLSLSEIDINRLKQISNTSKRMFLYLDPPYVQKGNACYKFTVDHEKLAETLLSLPKDIEWLLSYDDCELVRELYSGCLISNIEVMYSSNTKTRGSTGEILIQRKQ